MHKLKSGQNVTHLKCRPIVACPGSLLHPLGIWIDRKLQVIAKQQESYFWNSFELRQGTPRAPPYATIYYGIHEKNFLPKHIKHVIFYKQFIDDVFGIWIPHPNPQTDAHLWEEI